MSPRMAGWLAWSLFAVFVVLQVSSFVLFRIGGGEPDPLFSVVTVGYVTAGALIASRRPTNTVGWLMIAIALTFAIQAFGEVYVTVSSAPGRAAAAWVSSWMLYVWGTLAVGILPLLFPDGRPLSPRWRPVVWSAVGGLTLSVIGAGFKPGRLRVEEPLPNPLGASGFAADAVTLAELLGNIVIVLVARGLERQQVKWLAYVGLLALVGVALGMVQSFVPSSWRDLVSAVGWFTILFTCTIGIPAAVGMAILRHRLYDIDLVIKRTLVYGALTATLVATYLALVLVLRLALGPVTGDSDLAVAGSTLAVAALIRPLRSRIQSVVDRRFYRARYDAGRTLEGFAVHLRDELDLETLGSDLQHVVHDTMQPAHVSLWLRGAAR